MERLMGLLGMVAFVALAAGLSRHRRSIHWKTVFWGLGLQWIFAVIVLKGTWIKEALSFLPWPTLHVFKAGTSEQWHAQFGWIILLLMFTPMLLRRFAGYQNKGLNWGIFGVVVLGLLRGNLVGHAFDKMRIGVEHLMAYAHEGAAFVFGRLADANQGAGAVVLNSSGASIGNIGMVFAFVVLPTIIFVASIFAVLYYLGVMQWVVGACARAMGRLLKVSGAESVSVAASILMGQTEAPLTIRPFLSRLTQSELMVIMTAGMAHVSGSIMVAYVQIAHVDIVHLITAVIMTAPGAVMMAKILQPEVEQPETQLSAGGGDLNVDIPNHDANVLDAAARGAFEGGSLAFNVAVMLVAFIALVALVNGLIKGLVPGLSLEVILGTVFKPFAYLMGVPWSEAGQIGALLGKRMVVNEFVAFIELGQMAGLSAKAKLVSTFALCGFANFSSIAIQVGGIGALIPERRGDLARLGLRAMLAGTLANFISACIAGVLG